MKNTLSYFLMIILLILSCETKPEKETSAGGKLVKDSLEKDDEKDSSMSIVESLSVNQTSYFIDSSKIKRINQYRDSIINASEKLYLITKDHQDHECFRTDSLFYSKNKELIINRSIHGCLDEETVTQKIYLTSNLVFYSELKLGDKVPYQKKIIYFDMLKPILGVKYDYELDLSDRTITDSVLHYINLGIVAKANHSYDSFTQSTLKEIQNLRIIEIEDRIFTLMDTISFAESEVSYSFDSVSYNILIDK